MTDQNGINIDQLQPEDVVKPKRTRKTKVEKTEDTVNESASATAQSGKYTHPEYDMYMAYKEYFEQQQKAVLEYWTVVLRNIWNLPK